VAAAEAMANTIKQTDRNIDVSDDYNTAPANAPAAGDGFMEVPEGADRDLPFN